ncbi:MAG: TAXI family TRAP transporter solute-binding subunit [Desulfobacterales bacterium]|nr:TAXI family TRAP transporter solute-binding subunit [Desulfobacterales bacterium]
MRKPTVVLILLFVLFGLLTQANAMGIVTGSTKGTYYQIGNDIKELLSDYEIDMVVHPSNGSIENVDAVYKRSGVQLGIVQSDVLAYIKKSNDIRRKRIAEKLRMVFPLYDEEIHILATNDINTFLDLEGKVVAMGKKGSGTYLTSTLLFSLAGITAKEVIEIGGKEAIESLKNGKIDAMLYVIGYPAPLFQEYDSEKFHLVPITEKSIAENYSKSVIPAKTYQWQDENVSTVSVKAVLMTYNYKRNNCDRVGNVARIIYENLESLKRKGHKKWGNVKLDLPVSGWEQYECVKKQKLAKKKYYNKKKNRKPNFVDDVMDELRKMNEGYGNYTQ